MLGRTDRSRGGAVELSDLAVVLAALTVAGLLAGRLGLSAIPIYICAGLLLGPGEPSATHLIDPSEGTELLSRLGIVLLLFFLGLEFSLDRLTQARRMTVVGGVVDLAISGGASLLVALALVGPEVEAILLAGLLYISSSAITTRALFDFRRLADPETDLVLGVLVFEDLAIALFLGIAAALAAGEAAGPGEIVVTAAIALGFVLAFLVASKYAPRVIDRVAPRFEREPLLLATLAIAVGSAALAEVAGLSEAIGALLAGVLVSSSSIRDEIEEQLLSLRDFAAGIFFFSFGLEVDLGQADEVATWIAVAVPVAIVAKVMTGYVAGRVTGLTNRRSLNAGAALVPRGEFSIILAQLAIGGAALDVAFREQVEAFAGVLVLGTTIVGVLFMRESRRVGRVLFPRSVAAVASKEGVPE
jgi:CPA2 family monovalent cation:H+ antiporter-2